MTSTWILGIDAMAEVVADVGLDVAARRDDRNR